MIKIFITSDYLERDPVLKQNVALAHILVGCWFGVLAIVLGFGEISAPIFAGLYLIKEIVFDLRVMFKRWLALLDSLVDLLMGVMGVLFVDAIWTGNLLFALTFMTVSIATTFTYYWKR